LESEDYAVRPFSISASSIGANHQRERVWIVAHTKRKGLERLNKQSSSLSGKNKGAQLGNESSRETMANSRRSQWPWSELREENENETRKENANQFKRSSSTSEINVANADSERLEKWESIRKNFEQKQSTSIRTGSKNADVANAERIGQQRQGQSFRSSSAEKNSDGQTGWSYDGSQGAEGWWESEPDVGRVAHGIPKRVDRLKSLGNSLVPQIPYYIGKTILEVMNGKTN
jgi:DNA (cytosine-5)-methyltransferase 1